MKLTGYQIQPVRVIYEESVTGTHVVLRLQTDEGIEGISYVSRIGPPTLRALVNLLEAYSEQQLGQDPLNTEAIYARMYRGLATIAGLECRAASAIDAACWDIKGKAFGQPVYRLMGGFRDRLPVSANWGVQHGANPEEVAAAGQKHLDRGYRAMKFQLGQLDRETAVAHIRTVREAVGPGVKLIVDANQRWTAKQAIEMGEAIAPYEPYWIEDPVPHYDYTGLRLVRESLTTLICAGENYQNVPQFKRLMEEGSADIAMVDLDLGLTGFLKVAHMAEAHGLPLVNHLASEILAHGIAAVPNGLIVGFYPWAQPLLQEQVRIEDGQIVMSQRPGLGLDLDESALKHFAIE